MQGSSYRHLLSTNTGSECKDLFMTVTMEVEFNGNRNHEALAEGYNSFIKLTGVWFTGEIRETMRNLAR
jgi:hypothetical protein